MPFGGKAVWVEELCLLEDCRCLVGIPDAIHDTPAFGDLVALQGKSSEAPVLALAIALLILNI